MIRRKSARPGEIYDKMVKAAIKKVSPSVVHVITHDDLPADMTEIPLTHKAVFTGDGIVLECHCAGERNYQVTVLTPAVLFHHTHNLTPLDQIKVDVCVSGGKLYEGELVACDFHNNLAAVKIQSKHPLQAANLRGLDDVSSINLNDYDRPRFQLLPHSKLFKVTRKTVIYTLSRSCTPPYGLISVRGFFGASNYRYFSSKELYSITGDIYNTNGGGAVINLAGEVLGIRFSNRSFLPSNIISRWWDHFKTQKKFCQPCVGVEVVNLDEAPLNFLEQLKVEFPDIGTGVIVTKIADTTPAYCSGIRHKDVIVKYDGKPVQSKMEFFQTVWDNVGKTVDLNVLRPGDGQRLNISMTIENTAQENFNRWRPPICDFWPCSKISEMKSLC